MLEALVPGLREANRRVDERAAIGTQRVLATRDPLTGLLNERALRAVGRSVLSWASRHGEPLSVLTCSFGSAEAPDRLVLCVADALRECLDDGDVAARTAPGELTALLVDADERQAAERAAAVRRALEACGDPTLSRPVDCSSVSFDLVSIAPGDCVDIEDLFAAAHGPGVVGAARRGQGNGRPTGRRGGRRGVVMARADGRVLAQVGEPTARWSLRRCHRSTDSPGALR